MKIYTVVFIFTLITIFLGFPNDILRATEENALNEFTIPVVKVMVSPFLDGASLDACWQIVPKYNIETFNGKKQRLIQLQVCRSEDKIFFKVNFPALKKKDSYKCWHWDPIIQAYILGNEKEETLCIMISSEDNLLSDVWVWRSARTNAVATLDDMFMNNKKEFFTDAGRRCWYGRFFGNYAGVVLPRFYNRVPSGSIADVDAIGIWRNQEYTIEIARKLNTGHNDDLIFKSGEYFIQMFLYMPDINQLKFSKHKFKLRID